jgi:hypothetical protein
LILKASKILKMVVENKFRAVPKTPFLKPQGALRGL